MQGQKHGHKSNERKETAPHRLSADTLVDWEDKGEADITPTSGFQDYRTLNIGNMNAKDFGKISEEDIECLQRKLDIACLHTK